MKKLKYILIALIGFLPIICYAKENDEMKWRWYTLIESDVSYVTDVKQICEDLKVDYSDYILTNWIYSKELPEEKENREIVKTIENISLDRNEFSMIKISSFGVYDQEISELKFYDENGNIINYTYLEGFFNNEDLIFLTDGKNDKFVKVNSFTNLFIELETVVNIKDLNYEIVYKKNNHEFKGINFETYITREIMTNAYAPYSMNNNESCIEDVCTIKSSVNLDMLYEENIDVKTSVYKYRDKYIKCYKEEKIYVPGYYSDLEGYIKDENDYIFEPVTIDYNKLYKEPFIEIEQNPIEEIIESDKINESKEEDNKQISMVTTKTKPKETSTYYGIYIFLLAITLIATTVVIIKKVKRCRTK